MIIEEKIYKDIKKYTGVDYEGWLNKDREEYFVTSDNVLAMLEDLICEIEHWKEKYEDFQEDVKSNFERVPVSRQVQISDNDFIDKDLL